MRRTSFVVLLAACAAPQRAPESSALLEAHVSDAQVASAARRGPEPESLAPFEAKAKAIRDGWQERLGKPETILSFFDFTTPEMSRLRAEAAGEDFAATLGTELTLDRALAGAFVRNPDLRAAHRQLAATVEEYSQVTYLDTILRQYVSFLRTLNTRVGPVVPMDQVQKRFPFPGTLELKAAVVGHAVEAAEAKYEAALRDLVTDVRTAYADYVYLARALSITKETLRLLVQLEATVRGKLASGTAEKSHVLLVQVQISQYENDVVTLEQQRETVRARLNTLLDLPPQAPLAEPAAPSWGFFPTNVEALYARALNEQPDIRLALARADRMATMIELAEKATYPELSAGFSSMEDISLASGGSKKEREPFPGKAQVKPDPWFGSKEAYLREARESERAARAAYAGARDRTLYRVKDAYVQLNTAKRLYDLYHDVQVSQAQEAYSDAAASYTADRLEFLNVIDALRLWLRFLLDEDRAMRDYHIAHARLESAIGGSVQREGK